MVNHACPGDNGNVSTMIMVKGRREGGRGRGRESTQRPVWRPKAAVSNDSNTSARFLNFNAFNVELFVLNCIVFIC